LIIKAASKSWFWRSQAIRALDKISQSASKPGRGSPINQVVIRGYGHIEHFPRLQAAVDVSRLRRDASHGDHQGRRRDRNAPAAAWAEHTDRAHADCPAKTF
jgi:hypothetical protein